MNQFSYGPFTPALAFAASYVGCLLGLMCSSRARVLSRAGRTGWLTLAAVSFGGTGLWVMHFIAMLGFSMDTVQIRYRIVPTVLSALIAMAGIGAGLAVAGADPHKVHRVVGGALLVATGAAGMHHVGMTALVVPATMSYQTAPLALWVTIAVSGAAMTLWFTQTISRRVVTILAAALIAAVFCAMHYTAMLAMTMMPDDRAAADGGAAFTTLLLPLLLLVGIITVIMLLVVAFSASPAELVDYAQFEARLAQQRGDMGRDRQRAGVAARSAAGEPAPSDRRTTRPRRSEGSLPAPSLTRPPSDSWRTGR